MSKLFATYEAEELPEINTPYTAPQVNLPTFRTTVLKTEETKPTTKKEWATEYRTEIPKTNNSQFRNGDTVEINSSKSKYGHTATYYNGKWYSDFAQNNMNPYNDPNARIRIFRNPNAQEAEQQAARIASRAGAKSKHLCAKYVREGLGYSAEGYNGNNFGDFLTKKGWSRIAKDGMKFQEGGIFAIHESVELPKLNLSGFTNPYQKEYTFNTYVDPSKIKKETSPSNDWVTNYRIEDKPQLSTSGNQYVDYLKSKGLSDIAAKGIFGNIMQESGGNTSIVSKDGHNSIGLAQWTGARRLALEKMYGKNPTWQNQLDFILHELNTTHKKALASLQNAQSIEEATEGFMKHYEKPNEKYANLKRRISFAKSLE